MISDLNIKLLNPSNLTKCWVSIVLKAKIPRPSSFNILFRLLWVHKMQSIFCCVERDAFGTEGFYQTLSLQFNQWIEITECTLLFLEFIRLISVIIPWMCVQMYTTRSRKSSRRITTLYSKCIIPYTSMTTGIRQSNPSGLFFVTKQFFS